MHASPILRIQVSRYRRSEQPGAPAISVYIVRRGRPFPVFQLATQTDNIEEAHLIASNLSGLYDVEVEVTGPGNPPSMPLEDSP